MTQTNDGVLVEKELAEDVRPKRLTSTTLPALDPTLHESAPNQAASPTVGGSVGGWSERQPPNVQMSRALAMQMTAEQREALYREHRELALECTINPDVSRQTRARFQTVQWAIDRLEDAQVGIGLDFLEAVAAERAEIARQVKAVTDALGDRNPRAPQPNRRRPK